jgi:membrane-associated protease RseP (regulator of RpoE activity)
MASLRPVIEGALVSAPVVSRHGVFFWLLRTLVKVRYTFFLSSVLLGMSSRSIPLLLVWVIASFVAILLHEMGHALAARYYRQNPTVELHMWGGVTRWAWRDELTWHQRALISFAGPGIGFVFGGLLYLGPSVDLPYLAWVAKRDLLWITLGWGLFNLLPILPLDGGNMLAEFLQHWRGGDEGRLRTRQISVATGFVGTVAGFMLGMAWAGILCAVFAFDNLQRMRGRPGVELPR